MTRIAINGFGRIGRQSLRVLDNHKDLELVAINDLTDNKTLAHLLKFDSTYGEFEKEVHLEGEDHIIVGDKRIRVLSEKDPEKLPWKELGIDIVLECTGVFRKREGASKHILAGAKKVILSAPAKDEIDGTFVIGVNESGYDPLHHSIISNASCTTNCLAPIVKLLNDNFGIEKGVMTTIHSVTNDQKILDLPHKDLRRARSAYESIIPTTTGAAKAVSLVIPEMEGKLDGLAIRVPTLTVSIVDLVCNLKKDVTKEEINNIFKRSEKNGIIKYEDRPLVSIDYRKKPYSAIIDGLSTKVIGDNMVKILAWYDNEWGYTCRLIDLCSFVANQI